MINPDLFKIAVSQNYKSKSLMKELDKTYNSHNSDYEVSCFYVDRKQTGLLFFLSDGDYYAAKISKSSVTADKSGRLKPIICDLCYTRMPGSKIAKVTAVRKTDSHSFTWLMCDNLDCSLNSREKTTESEDSKKILGENITIDQRIRRLEKHIKNIVNTLQLQPLNGDSHE
jgi:hypothetical protein